MTSVTLKWFPLSMLLLLAGCATLPTGPSVVVLPGSGKNFNQFRSDDLMCQQFALEQVGGVTPNQTASQSGVASAVVGTAVGAAAGALMGGERGAAVGAGGGLLVGSMAGTSTAQGSSNYLQKRYDNVYIQCMYANGHLVPLDGHVYMNTRVRTEDTGPIAPTPPSPPGVKIPPPPPGPPPSPPPGM